MSIDVAMHDRCDGIEKGQRILAGRFTDGIGKRRRGEGPVATIDVVPVRRRQAAISSRSIGSADGLRSLRLPRGKAIAVDSKRAAGRHLMASAVRMISEPSRRISSCSRPTALYSRIVGAEGIRADEFGECVGAVSGGRAQRAHLVDYSGDAAPAICQAASQPARPPPMMWMGAGPVMGD